jgi:PAS domain-containing protein
MASAGQSTEQARHGQDVDAIPTLAWFARPDGPAEFLNRRWLDYTGLAAEEAVSFQSRFSCAGPRIGLRLAPHTFSCRNRFLCFSAMSL